MSLQFSTEVRNGRLDAIESVIGAGPVLRIRSGAPPASTSSARAGTVLSTLNLPADWANAAANASKTLLGTWQDVDGADAAGTAGHFEIDQGGVIHMQGTVTGTGGGGDMEVSNTNFAAGQPFSVTSFTINEPNG